MEWLRYWVFLVGVLGLWSCASYRYASRGAVRDFQAGDFLAAAKKYEACIDKAGNDRLLALLDTALAYYYAGEYEKSIRYFLEADRLADELDYISVSRQTASILATDYALQYKGEEFERVLINTYLALAYLFSGNLEDALVECRRIDRRIRKFKETRDYELAFNPFSLYLSGLIYELAGEPDEAYVDYRKVYEVLPDFPLVRQDLLRLSEELGYTGDYQRWRRLFGEISYPRPGPEDGQLVIFFEAGLSPEKHQESRVIAIPVYHRRPSRVKYAKVYIDGQTRGRTQVVNDIEETAIQQLRLKMDKILIKQGLVTGTKVALAEGLGRSTDSRAVRDLALLFFYATNQADLRSWLTLPRDIQLWRGFLPEGRYRVELRLYGRVGRAVRRVDFGEVKIIPGEAKLLKFRSVE